MGFLEWLAFRRWPRPQSPPELDLHLGRGAIGSLALAEPCSRIAEVLGPPASWWNWRRHGWWLYPQHGLCVECEDDRISEIDLYTRDWFFPPGFDRTFRPFCAVVHLPNGSKIRPAELTPTRIVEILGPPQHQDGEIDEQDLSYELGAVTADLSYDGDRLVTMEIWADTD